MTEVELELRLDPEGRTTFDPAKLGVEGQGGTEEQKDIKSSTNNNKNETKTVLKGGQKKDVTLDYSSKTVLTSLADESRSTLFQNDNEKRHEFLDELLFDCEITDCALLPRTFWIPATGMEPRCALEQCALEVFNHHVKDGIKFDPETSGAEWWVQIRPSPQAGRYNLLQDSANNEAKSSEKGDENGDNKRNNKESCDDDEDMETSGICFHWDKDEDLRLMMGGKMYIHPHVSTVTYLSDSGAPTMAINYRVNNFTGMYESPPEAEPVDAYLSWPKRGKHLSFDGRYLHAAPPNLMKKGDWEKQISLPNDVSTKIDEKERKKLSRRRRRTTFLVNIWLNYKPFNVNTFPETMMDKMSKTHDGGILFNARSEKDAKTDNQSAQSLSHDESSHQYPGNVKFKWPMGACGSKESITMVLPLEKIQNEMKNGGNIHMNWTSTLEKDRAVRIQTSENDGSSKRQKLE